MASFSARHSAAVIDARRVYWRSRGFVLVRSHWRSAPYMAWTGIKDVFVSEHVRRPPLFQVANLEHLIMF
jgi:hypothetical protein